MKKSAGILAWRRKRKALEFFLVHPGGPFWKNKDHGAWSIPKGEFTVDEDPEMAARREFQEETGFTLTGHLAPLTPIKNKSGKMIYAWAVEGDFEAATVQSNMFDFEWPPRSGKMIAVPEVDKAGWFDLETALLKINSGQASLLHEAQSRFGSSGK